MKWLVTLALLVATGLGLYAYIPGSSSKPVSYLFDQVLIQGATNIHQFELSYKETSFSEFLPPKSGPGNLHLEIPAHKIEAQSQLMRKDFLELINADRHPNIVISLNDQITDNLAHKTLNQHAINISMNGITRSYHCRSEVNLSSANQWTMSGKIKVLLSDFEIHPPKKFFGLMRIQDEVFISFNLLLSTNNLSS